MTTTTTTFEEIDAKVKLAVDQAFTKARELRMDAVCADKHTRSAAIQAVLDAIGYKLPVDPEREAFDAWYQTAQIPQGETQAFASWKAGRDNLRQFRQEQASSALDEIIPQTAKQPENDGWIPWSGGECPVSGTTTVSLRFRNGSEGNDIDAPLLWDWTHNVNKPTQADIIAYKLTPQTTTK